MTGIRLVKSCSGVSILFILLGVGNVWFGLHKYNDYTRVLSEARAELTSPSQIESLPKASTSLNVDRQTQHINRVLMRLDFYQFVIRGGEFFLGLGALVGLLALILFSETLRERSRETPNNVI